MALTDKLTAIGDAIREKTGGTDALTLDGMVTEIEGIKTGGGDINALIDRSITEVNSNATSVGMYAFSDCEALTTADFPACTSIGESAFNECDALTTVAFPACTSIGTRAFYFCDALTTVAFPACTSIDDYAFSYCEALTTADFPACTSISERAFNSCGALMTVAFPACTSIGDNAFNDCSALTTVAFPACTSIGRSAFGICDALTTADFSAATKILNYAFSSCDAFTALVLRSETMATLSNTNAFQNMPIAFGTGYIYVPSALVASYQAATNWTTYSAQFRALEDYTVDGTITGELDPNKI